MAAKKTKKKFDCSFDYIKDLAWRVTGKHYAYREAAEKFELGALIETGSGEIVFRGTKNDSETFLSGIIEGYEMAQKAAASRAAISAMPATGRTI